MTGSPGVCFLLLCVAQLAVATGAAAQTALSGPPLRIARAAGPITVDGVLGDEAWHRADAVERWYETNPGDNVEPSVRSVGRLAYDDRFFYAAFEFDDPNPGAIRAPYSDRDGVSGNATDYGGVILDTRNDGHSAVLLLATPRGVQYDAVTDDATSEDSAPDFFWDAAARITDRGWTLELRVPFSSLRYRNTDPQTWGILLYRNYPRDFRYQMFSAPLPRGGNCFICRANTLVGLAGLPQGGRVIAAPYVSAASESRPESGIGSPLGGAVATLRGGADVKWIPTADNAVDLTVKPDFSQIESDTAQITANERFALLVPEKRPFFLEGVELLTTPIQAVYTRTVTAPRWGSRLTGKASGLGYTALVADDAGGGSVVIPGPNGSSLGNQEFGSYVAIARVKRDIGRSFVGLLLTDRETRDGRGSYNRVVGPDFQWRPITSQVVTGQVLFSATKNIASFSSHAADIEWTHDTTRLDLNARYKNLGDDFRADTGFVPQVGYREIKGGGGWTIRPSGFVRRLRTDIELQRQVDEPGVLISEHVTPAVEMDVRWTGFVRLRFINERTRAGDRAFDRRQLGYFVRFNPSPRLAEIRAEGTIGQEIDFENSRGGTGNTINLGATINATQHLELVLLHNERLLNVSAVSLPSADPERLFTARISRVRGTYTFTARSFARVIAQYVSTTRNPRLYADEVSRRSAELTGSVLFAYKLNWQSVLFVGYGDARELSERESLEPAGRQAFVKVSYAFQR